MEAARLARTIVVQKFGGSSLATPELRELAAQRVMAVLDAGKAAVVVTSAMGRLPAPYATDSLAALAPRAQAGPNRDLLLATGEMIAAGVFAELLGERGVPSLALTGEQAGILTDKTHGDAAIARVDAARLHALLAAGITPVVAGFQGASADGTITTLGRGGSDLTAVALASSLGDAKLEVFTDVDGVMTADPRRVVDAHTIGALTFEELSELAAHGARVMHDKAAELAHSARTPLSVRSLRTGFGTEISDDAFIDHSRPVSGIATMEGYTFVHATPEAAGAKSGWERDAFKKLADAEISIDCVNVNAAGIFFIVADREYERAHALFEDGPLALRARRDCAKISIVGAGMRGTPGVVYRVVDALSRAGVPIIHSTDSNITVSVLVPGSQAGVAETALHDHFGLKG
ncbi:MAG TPA: aspartate kinase [Candidatus Eremiobacteraceae bacterium]